MSLTKSTDHGMTVGPRTAAAPAAQDGRPVKDGLITTTGMAQAAEKVGYRAAKAKVKAQEAKGKAAKGKDPTIHVIAEATTLTTVSTVLPMVTHGTTRTGTPTTHTDGLSMSHQETAVIKNNGNRTSKLREMITPPTRATWLMIMPASRGAHHDARAFDETISEPTQIDNNKTDGATRMKITNHEKPYVEVKTIE